MQVDPSREVKIPHSIPIKDIVVIVWEEDERKETPLPDYLTVALNTQPPSDPDCRLSLHHCEGAYIQTASKQELRELAVSQEQFFLVNPRKI